MKLTKIAKLNAERTQIFDVTTAEEKEEGQFDCIVCNGDAYCKGCDGDGIVNGTQYINVGNEPVNVLFTGIGEQVRHNESFFNAAPKMANMLCKLKDFVVMPEFVESVKKKCESPRNTTMYEGKLYALVIETLIEELEKNE